MGLPEIKPGSCDVRVLTGLQGKAGNAMLNHVGEDEKTTFPAYYISKILSDLRVIAALKFRAKAIHLLKKAMRILFVAPR